MGKISMKKVSEILRQRYELKRSYRDIARSLNISMSTINTYLGLAKASGLRWPLPTDVTEDQLSALLFPKSQADQARPLPDWNWVQKEHRKKGVTLQLLWREYRDRHPNGVGYSQFCSLYRVHKKSVAPTMRQVHKAGEKTFVDYAGHTMEWINPVTAEIHQAQIFVAALGASQLIYIEATATQSLPDWIHSHCNMWEYFGGVTEIVVPDNLKAAVTQAHRYDPDINSNYQHLGEHYGFAIVPARVRSPKDKAKVENAVKIVTEQILAPLRHVTFTSLTQLNQALRQRLERLNQQKFQQLDFSRRDLFREVDQPALKPLPPQRYHYAEWKGAKVHIDYHITFEKYYYSVPYQYIQKEIDIRATATTVECFYQGQRIAIHQRACSKQRYITLKEHMPPAHRAQQQWGPDRIQRWAQKIGPQTKDLIQSVLDSRPIEQQAYRACLGILRLGQRYGEQRLEKAAVIALAQGMTRYRQIESILKNKMDQLPPPTDPTTEPINTAHHNIRGAHYYQ